ncbi:flagellar hook-associated protein FlgK [Clostridium thermarum]|uniref:flagellar hook-associated protein FlgK n=1 Tax=Clostridium thermarum TaxID=1716543 RepID=UPI0011208B0D|nr:flagellar hook-associated protein FlgK [Clostridium thermarum]
MSGLFSTFNVAKRGMNVQQKAIEVTSHNIANANTEGYSRQRVLVETTRPFGMSSLNSVAEPGQLGTGAQISAIQRVRDTFLDYQVRVETSTYGKYEARQKFLNEVESIFNEPSETGLSTLLGKFFDSWQQLSKQAHSSNARTVVAQQSAALAEELNHTYNQLVKLKSNANELTNSNVLDINSLVSQINELNQQIIGVKVAGNMPNDLMDKRDLLLDQLSQKIDIKIVKDDFEGINVYPADINGVEQPALVRAKPNDQVNRLSSIRDIKQVVDADGKPVPGQYTISYFPMGDITNQYKTITVEGLSEADVKEIEQTRVMWAAKNGNIIGKDGNPIADNSVVDVSQLNLFKPSSGELNGYMTITQDIDVYIDQLNSMAKALAFAVNAVHSGKSNAADDSIPFFVNNDVARNTTDASKIAEAEKEITAGNISVNKRILEDVMLIKTRTNDYQFNNPADNDIDGETDGARAQAIARLRDVLIRIQDMGDTITSRQQLIDLNGGFGDSSNMSIPSDTSGMTIDNFFKDTINKLGIQAQEAKRIVKNQAALLNSFNESRLSISGVSLDEEMANLIQFQHAYQANAKIISTVDELLDVVVNGLKR